MREKLLKRLDEIAGVVKESGKGVALMGLGSTGQGVSRMDDYSDLDFFVIVKPGEKPYFMDSLAWLEAVHPVVFSFMNTVDGYKVLFADGIFCETAVFEPDDLANIPYSQGRVIWQDAASTFVIPESNGVEEKESNVPDVEFLLGETLSNLLVGLGRFRRGEKLTAARFIQDYALSHVVALAPLIEEEQGNTADEFNKDRRFEQRFPGISAALPGMMQGYERSPQSALAILHFLEEKFTVNQELKRLIISLAS